MLVLNIFGTYGRGRTLCVNCAYAHVEIGYRREVLAFCNFGCTMRRVEIDVCECTDFVDRRAAKPVKVTGFVKREDEASA